ncbi:PTS sugar transporter subunit IIB [Clostridium algidicarnis]|uniref:PTS sugar transporter subunit IIB n=1 Tax=Clostridium algidicarnis TaxID=37659 RepID=UPI0016293BCD|nr:PTS sugar transporter subunit IIB [Clostridium algidicarnis]MBB6696557.1 PTS sugar transporter subunit IIB [Clostridium algidicarnis]MBU3194806.1 PTS sugar transporter subunit IIB [Clostridium algidicarnis]MBU3202814.1 PTS sugar transporter subunit IIB [Clostridium algidicarnis]MBU3205879.1 PTS sugar transporter subunit IIB [Clostridium algidicarnis]MBU3210968.1 PTS sugar transporter subunit IIB [Clostridium algidicarnis]
MKTIFRVDSRIVHGQTVNYWCRKYNVSKIIVANDELAKDDFRKLFFKIAISDEIDLEFLTIKGSISKEYDKTINCMVIFEKIDDVIKYVKEEGKINKIILSNIGYGEGKVKMSEGVFLNEKDKEKVSILQEDYGVDVVYKMMPD